MRPNPMQFNPLPNDKILHKSKLKAVADNKINVAEKLKTVLGRMENIVGKEENAGYQAFENNISFTHIVFKSLH